VPFTSGYWSANPKKHEREAMEALWTPGDDLKIFSVNVEGLSTQKAKDALKSFLLSRTAMLVVDESSRIKTPGAKRTKALLNLGKYAPYRRILTGSPITQGPLDVYSQFKFLDPSILGFTTYTAFSHHYAEFERRRTNSNRSGYFEVITQYKNLSELSENIKEYSYRVTKDQVLDLPPKIYQTRQVELGKEQRRMYNQLLEEGVASLGEDVQDAEQALWDMLTGENPTVSVTNALSLQLRLQQIIGNWMVDSEGNTHKIEKTNKRLEQLKQVLEETSGQVIVWACFVKELEEIYEALEDTTVLYYGAIDGQTRQEAVEKFQNGEARVFLGNPLAGGIGLNLTAANTVIYYSNTFSYEIRTQSEDRAHRIGTTDPVSYIDLEAVDTIDEKVTRALQEKANIANHIIDGSELVEGQTGVQLAEEGV